MSSDIQPVLMHADGRHVLGLLLSDKTSKSNILWGTDTYAEMGTSYTRESQITPELITGRHCNLIRSRARKRLDLQSIRTRTHAEVFTPMWVCAKMNDAIDEEWFGSTHVFFDEHGNRTNRVVFPAGVEHRTWRDYVKSKRLEITCGEAPYLINRYDVATGISVDLEHRAGILDRKLRVVDENAADENEWMQWAIRAIQASFGYEFQGDNLLIARLNVLATFEEYLEHRWHREATDAELRKVANVIAWNVWQMDGLTYRIPFDTTSDAPMDLFESAGLEDSQEVSAAKRISRCRVYDWSSNRSQVLVSERGKATMKFDYIIGNPPYQEEVEGDNKTYAKPIYDRFLDASYKLGNVVEMIHPARFLFDAGSTPKAWNEKMLNDEHLKVLWYCNDSKKVFANTDIKGGIAVTLHDEKSILGPIRIFTRFPLLNTILEKTQNDASAGGLASIMANQNRFNLDEVYKDYPQYQNVIGSNGKDKRFRNNIFQTVPLLFSSEKDNDSSIPVYGVIGSANTRTVKYINRKYVDLNHENLQGWKLLVVRANGSGAFGEILGEPIIAKPWEGYTQTFLGIGPFKTENEALHTLTYVKTKFLRAHLGALKVTQDNPIPLWRLIPLQDFTSSSDIDWSQSVADIDKQLYKKYHLTDEEIDFIEKNVKEMK